jgi:hypothetical protein
MQLQIKGNHRGLERSQSFSLVKTAFFIGGPTSFQCQHFHKWTSRDMHHWLTILRNARNFLSIIIYVDARKEMPHAYHEESMV